LESKVLESMISGFRREVLRTALFWVITQRVVVISYRRFGTTYRSHPVSSQNVGKKLALLAFSYKLEERISQSTKGNIWI